MMRFFIFCFVLFYVFNIFSQVQEDTNSVMYKSGQYQTSLSLLTGFHYWRYAVVEIGIASNTSGLDFIHAYERTRYLSNEIWINEKPVIGLKAGIRAAGGFASLSENLNLIYYTDFSKGTLRIRPEYGIWFAYMNMLVAYCYNFALINKNYPKINRHNISFIFPWKIKHIKNTYRESPPPIF